MIESGLNDRVKYIGVKKHDTFHLLNKLANKLIRLLKYSFSTKLISKVLAFNYTNFTSLVLGRCSTKCERYVNNPRRVKFGGGMVYHINHDDDSIQIEILQNGPVTALLRVHEDFPLYQEGVYSHLYGQLKGVQAVKIIGWGEENGVKYWKCTNSWSEKWCESGLFRLKRENTRDFLEITAAKPR